ncbi:MAG: hypothetical protein ACRCXB_04265 [Aeromonadaceae bacterium]
MKVIDLTGENRAVLGFRLEKKPDGTVHGIFEVSSAEGIGEPGTLTDPNMPTVTELQIKFDKTASITSFLQVLGNGGNRMAYAQMAEQIRKENLAADAKATKQANLAARIEKMAKELSALQGEYAELQD